VVKRKSKEGGGEIMRALDDVEIVSTPWFCSKQRLRKSIVCDSSSSVMANFGKRTL
jgi:hypothetical protein